MSSSTMETFYAFLITLSTLWTLFFGTVGIYDKLQQLKKVPIIDWVAKLVALLKYTFILISVGLAICVLILSSTLLNTLLSRPTGGSTSSPSTLSTATLTSTTIATGPPTSFSVTTITLNNGQLIQNGQSYPVKDSPLTITGTDMSQGSGQVWVVVEDAPGNYYLQHPAVQFDENGQWTARNIVTAVGVVKIDFVYVTPEGNRTFQQKVDDGAYGAFSKLPDGSKIPQTINITVTK